jgi:hypothetical protein
MGLADGDLEKVPPELTAHDCYDRIWKWHRTFGEQEARRRELPPDDRDRYLGILAELPTDTDALPEDVDFLFFEVLTGEFEWSYHVEDSDGVKMAAYAEHGAEKNHGNDWAALGKSAKRSALNRLKT